MHKLITHLYFLSISALLLNPLSVEAQTEHLTKTMTPVEEHRKELNAAKLRANEGDPNSQFEVALLFTNNRLVRPDHEQAVYWYRQAASQGHLLAHYNLGHQYLNGLGVTQSTETAVQWWLKAARLGHPLSQYNVARAYYLGIGLRSDLTKAKYWFQKAAENKEPKSIEILNKLQWDTPKPKQVVAVAASDTKSTIVTQAPTLSTNDENTPSNPKAEAEPVSSASFTPDLSDAPIALYTNPSIQSFLIFTIDDRSNLEIVSSTDQWVNVRYKNGIPAWVHQDLVSVSGSQATLIASSVNARAVPLIVRGNIIGRLNKGDKVEVISQLKEWFRITSPASFTAWVKTADFKKTTSSQTANASLPQQAETTISVKDKDNTLADNPNDWLFKQKPEHFTLQLASIDNTEGVNQFISNSGLENDTNLHKFTSNKNDITWIYFLYNSYPSKANAEQAQKNVNIKGSWIRSIGRIQQNRCITWKKQIPAPKELNIYCTPPAN